MADEDGLASPFDDDLIGRLARCGGRHLYRVAETYVLALGDGSKIDLDLGLGEDVGGRGHVDEEVWGGLLVLARHHIASSYHPQNSQWLSPGFVKPFFLISRII